MQQDGIHNEWSNEDRTSKISARRISNAKPQEYVAGVGDYTHKRQQKLPLPRAFGSRGGRRKPAAPAVEEATPGPTKASTTKITTSHPLLSTPKGSSGSGQTTTNVRSRYSRKKKYTSRRRYTNVNQLLLPIPAQDSFWSSHWDYASNIALPPMHFYNCQDTTTTASYIPLPLLNYSNSAPTATAATYNEDAMLWQTYPLQVDCNDGSLGQPSYTYCHYQQYPPHLYLSTNPENISSAIVSLSSHGCLTSLPVYSYDYDGTTFYYSPSDAQLELPTYTMNTPTAIIDSVSASNVKDVLLHDTDTSVMGTRSENSCYIDSVHVRNGAEDVPQIQDSAKDLATSPDKCHKIIGPSDCHPTASIDEIHFEENHPYFYNYYPYYYQHWQPPHYPASSTDTCFPDGSLIIDPTNSFQLYHNEQEQQVALSLPRKDTKPSSTAEDGNTLAPKNEGMLIPPSHTDRCRLLEEEEEIGTRNAAEFPKGGANHSLRLQVSKLSLQEDEIIAPLLKAFHLECGNIKCLSLFQVVTQHAKSHPSFSYGFDALLTKLQHKSLAKTVGGNANVSTTDNKDLTKSQEEQQLERLLLLALEIKCNIDVITRIVVKCMNANSPSAVKRFALAELPLQDHQKNVLKFPVPYMNASKGKKKSRTKQQRYPFLESVLEKLMHIITNSFRTLIQLDDPTSELECSKIYLSAYEEYQRLVSIVKLLHRKGIQMNQPTKQMFEKYSSNFTGNYMALLHAIKNGKSWAWIKNMVLDNSPASILETKKDDLYPCFVAATCEASSLDVVFQLLALNTCWVPS
jgi:hypothetical protein